MYLEAIELSLVTSILLAIEYVKYKFKRKEKVRVINLIGIYIISSIIIYYFATILIEIWKYY